MVASMTEKKKQVPGWTYGHSESLNQDFAYRKDGNGNLELYTEDKTHYNWYEMKVIEKHHAPVPLEVHLCKKVFEGTIIE